LLFIPSVGKVNAMANEQDVTPGASEVRLAGEGTPSNALTQWLWAHPMLLDNLKVVFFVILILLCVIFAPEKPLKFIYTEF